MTIRSLKITLKFDVNTKYCILKDHLKEKIENVSNWRNLNFFFLNVYFFCLFYSYPDAQFLIIKNGGNPRINK